MNRPVLLFLLVLGSCAARDADVENWSIHDTIEWAKEQNLPDVRLMPPPQLNKRKP